MTGALQDSLILVLNAGSSSIKFAVFDRALDEVVSGEAASIGGAGVLRIGGARSELHLADHNAALAAVLEALTDQGVSLDQLAGAAHRVVHGGPNLTKPARVTPEIRDEIAACASLAPLHNPNALAAMAALSAQVPDLPQCASFDTAFHATNPDVATRYALPKGAATEGLRRYGFHGLSYASLTQRLPNMSGAPLPERLLAFHLGNGASICAIREGRSVATTMGYSPLDGLTMGTRAGGIDAVAVLHLVETLGVSETRDLLSQQSGLLGLSGHSADMRALLADEGADSAFAVEHFCYWALRHAGSLIAAMGGCDAIAFTGGIGENSREVRGRILEGLAWLGLTADPDKNASNAMFLHAEGSKVAAYIIPAEEERMIAADALHLLGQA